MGTNGVKETDICTLLLQKYNTREEPFTHLDQTTLAGYKQAYPYTDQLKNHKADSVEGYDPNSVQFFKTDLIQDLINLPLEQVTMGFVRNHPLNKQSMPLNFLYSA